MKNNRNINQLVDETLDSLSSIETVKVSPLFKEKVLNRMRNQGAEEDKVFVLNWFNPKFQAAALFCFVILNVFALSSTYANDYSEDVENFANIYGLSETSGDVFTIKSK